MRAVPACRSLPEGVEQVRHEGLVDACAGVFYVHECVLRARFAGPPFVRVRFDRHLDGAALIGKLDGVADEVVQDAAEGARVQARPRLLGHLAADGKHADDLPVIVFGRGVRDAEVRLLAVTGSP